MTDKSQDRRWMISAFGVLVSMMMLQMSNLGFSPLLPHIKEAFSMNYTQVGFFTGLNGIIALLVAIPAGMLAKRFGEKNMLTVGLLLVAGGLCILGVAADFFQAITGRAIWQIGYRCAFVCVMTAIAIITPPSLKSTLMGLIGAFASLAAVIGGPFGASIAQSHDWRFGMFGYGAMAIVGLVVFWLCYKKTASESTSQLPPLKEQAASSTARSAYKTPVVWLLALTMLLSSTIGLTTTYFVPPMMKAVYGVSTMQTAYMISSGFFCAIFTNLFIGYLSDRINRWKVLMACMATLIISSALIAYPDQTVFKVATLVTLAFGLVASNMIYALVGVVMKGRDVGPIMGVMTLGSGASGYVGPQLLGYLRDATGAFTAGWYAIALIAFVCLLLIAYLKTTTDRLAQKTAVTL